jgi:hypothetical protein
MFQDLVQDCVSIITLCLNQNFWFPNLSCSHGLMIVSSLWLAELAQPILFACFRKVLLQLCCCT